MLGVTENNQKSLTKSFVFSSTAFDKMSPPAIPPNMFDDAADEDWLVPLPLDDVAVGESPSFEEVEVQDPSPPTPSATSTSAVLLPDGSVPMEKPKRPLSAYNLFFQDERKKLLDALPVRKTGKPRKSHGKLGFKEMATIVGTRWRNIDAQSKEYFERIAAEHKLRYNQVMKEYRRQQDMLKQLKEQAAPTLSSEACPSPPSLPPPSSSPRRHRPHVDPEIVKLARKLDPEMIDQIIKIFL